jgi:TonB family protein
MPSTPDAGPLREAPVKDPWVESMTRGIRDVVESHRDVIEDCYRRAVRAPGAPERVEGRVGIHLTIVPSGDAEDVRVVENRTGSEDLSRCLVNVMRTWQYPAPGPESMEFVWPFTFQGERRRVDDEGGGVAPGRVDE